MKLLSIIGIVLLMGVTSSASASCGTDYPNPATSGDVSNKQILATAPGGEEWNEDHCGSGSGDLYKVGDGTAVDPYALRGTWTFTDSGTSHDVEYTYTGDSNSPYTWTLWKNTAGDLCWDDGTSTTIATAPKPGAAGSCGAP